MEFLVPLALKNSSLMDGDCDYIIVGRPQEDAGIWTLIAEHTFSCADVENAHENFAAEVDSCRDLLATKLRQETNKRPAKDLIQDSPCKARCIDS